MDNRPGTVGVALCGYPAGAGDRKDRPYEGNRPMKTGIFGSSGQMCYNVFAYLGGQKVKLRKLLEALLVR